MDINNCHLDQSDTKTPLDIIGSNVFVSIGNIDNIPAKVDTGADSSSVWASQIEMSSNGVLSFVLFDKTSPLYTGEKIFVQEYRASVVRSSNGHEQIRYRVKMPASIGGHRIMTNFTLADRHANLFPVLIGRRTLKGRFLVDVSQMAIPKVHHPDTLKLNQELRQDPFQFHQKYGIIDPKGNN